MSVRSRCGAAAPLTAAAGLPLVRTGAMLMVLSLSALLAGPPAHAVLPDDAEAAAAILDHHDEPSPPASGEAGAEQDDGEEGLPLQAARHVEIATQTGTWLSLDLSPDGQALLFELLGDIYRLPAAGGTAEPLMTGMAFDSQPAYSPDGSLIAFVSDRGGSENLWIANADGSGAKQLSQESKALLTSPAWSADGQYVMVSKSTWALRTYELWMYHKDGGSGLQLTQAKPAPDTPNEQRNNVMGPAPSPDGRYVYYARKQGGFEYDLSMPQWNITRRSLDDGTENVIVTAQGSAMRPVLSNDGTLLVYATRYDAETALRVRNLVTGEDRWLIYPVTRDDQESRFTRDLMPAAAFTPDDSAIVTTFDGRLQRVDIATGEATAIPFTVNASLPVGPDLDRDVEIETGPVQVRLIQSVVQAPDDGRFAFSALGELYVHDGKPGGAVVRLAGAGRQAFHPSWTPDGRSLVYVTWSPEGGHLWRIRASAGAAPTRLTSLPAWYSNPVVSPDGRQIVALRAASISYLGREVDFGPPPGLDLVKLPAAGGEVELVAHAAGFGAPHFSTGSSERVFVYTPGGLLSLRLDGSDRRTHVQVKGPGVFFAEESVPADDVRLSPDGRWALAYVGNQLHMLAVPSFDRSGATVDISSPNVPQRQLTDIGADYFGWSADGQQIYWAIGATFHRLPVSSISFGDEEDEGDKEDEDGKKAESGDDAGTQAQTAEAWAPELKEADPAIERIEVQISVPRDVPAGAIVLRGGRVVTMRGDEVIDDADVVIVGNRIEAVGQRGSVAVPAGARIIDVAGSTLAPGFVDTHAHWFEIRRGVIDVNHWGFLANVAYGVTSGLDVQTATNDMFAYQDMIDAGRMIGLRAFSTGPGVFMDNAFTSRDHAYGVLKRYRDYYRTPNIKAYISGNRKQRQYVIQASQKLGMLPTTEGALDLKLDLTHAIDGFWGTEHALGITPIYDDVVQLMAGTGIAYTPTLLVAYGGPWAENWFYARENPHDDEKLRRFVPHDVLDGKALRRKWFAEQEHVFPRLAADAAKILRAGGRVGVGSHGQLQGLGYHWELWALASGGMTPMEALHCATLGGADIIGRERELGSIEAGKYADINVFAADPTADIRNTASLTHVMANGRLYLADTLEQVAPTPTPAPRPWFAGDAPENRLAGQQAAVAPPK